MIAFLKSNEALYRGYHELRLLRQRRNRTSFFNHERRIWQAKKDNLESLSRIALERVLWEREIFRSNEVYAHDLVIKKFLRVDPGRHLDVLVEHGCVITEVLVENHLTTPLARHNVVMSRPRCEFLGTRGIRAVAVGPYIHYAQPLLDSCEITKLKEGLGNTLLFFPSHSTLDICIKDSYLQLNELLRELKENHRFDSVLVCGYYIDIEKGLFDCIEKKEGYHFISCGDRHGPAFLELLKTFLLLADVVASNSIGSQTGYALFYGRPFWVVHSRDILAFYRGDPQKVREELAAATHPVLTEDRMSYLEFENVFKTQDFGVDPIALEYARSLWGFEEVMERDDLYRAVFPQAGDGAPIVV